MDTNQYKYVALHVACPGYKNTEYIAFPSLLADDEVRNRCKIRALASLRVACGSSGNFEECIKHSECHITHISEEKWQESRGYIW